MTDDNDTDTDFTEIDFAGRPTSAEEVTTTDRLLGFLADQRTDALTIRFEERIIVLDFGGGNALRLESVRDTPRLMLGPDYAYATTSRIHIVEDGEETDTLEPDRPFPVQIAGISETLELLSEANADDLIAALEGGDEADPDA